MLVDGYNSMGQLIIRDPALGTTYQTTFDDFAAWWSGIGVYCAP